MDLKTFATGKYRVDWVYPCGAVLHMTVYLLLGVGFTWDGRWSGKIGCPTHGMRCEASWREHL